VKARALRLAAAVAFLRAMIWYDHMRAAIAALWTLVPGTARAPEAKPGVVISAPADDDLDEEERRLFVRHTHLSDDRGRLLCGLDMGRAVAQGDRVCLTRKGFDAAPERCPACASVLAGKYATTEPCSVCNDVVCRQWPPHTPEERRRATS
jgi:hypothetical protein